MSGLSLQDNISNSIISSVSPTSMISNNIIISSPVTMTPMTSSIVTTNINVNSYELKKNDLSNIKNHVFVPKKSTFQLANIIENENWGNDNVLLYKYLDYIWRFQLIDKQVKIFKYNNEYRLVFNSGLITKYCKQSLYICLIPNTPNKNKAVQPWRIAFGNKNNKNQSFLTKNDLLQIYGFHINDVPIETNFIKDKIDAVFNPNYRVIINFEERIKSTKQRIIDTYKNDTGLSFDEKQLSTKKLKDMLYKSIVLSLKNVNKSPNLVGKQVFIERDLINNNKVTKGYHLELILPLTLTINNIDIYFAMILRSNHINKEYYGMSIITREMAYCNSRLIGPVTLPWLKPFVNTNVIYNYTNAINYFILGNDMYKTNTVKQTKCNCPQCTY